MKKFLKITLWVLAAIAVALVVIGLVGPKKYEVTRSALIKAGRQTVWDQVAMWKNFKNWSPWEKMDSTMTTKVEGNDGEVGSRYSWVSKEMGNGSMIIAETKPMDYRKAIFRMEDWGGESDVTFDLKDSAGGTFITWKMAGENGFVGRIFGFFMDMESMIGKDYQNGLESLKKYCESAPAISSAANYKVGEVETKSFSERTFVAIRHKMKMKDFETTSSDIFQNSAQKLGAYVQQNKLQITGTLFGIYYTWDTKDSSVDMEVAFPVDKEAKAEGDIHFSKVSTVNCAVLDYWGPYEQSWAAHVKMEKWFKDNKKENGGPVMEEYITDPQTEKDQSKWLTRVWYPIK